MWKKFSITAVLLASIVAIVSFTGRRMIEESGVFEAAQNSVRARFGPDGATPHVRLFAPFQFSVGAKSGRASFTLVREERCYPIAALMEGGKWTITVLEERKC
jgi:hypothetical protein